MLLPSPALPTRILDWQRHTDLLAVSAYNAGGHSPLSNETSSLPDPATPTSIAAVAGIEENTISWNSVAGATGYTLHYSESTPVTSSDSSFTVS